MILKCWSTSVQSACGENCKIYCQKQSFAMGYQRVEQKVMMKKNYRNALYEFVSEKKRCGLQNLNLVSNRLSLF